MYYILYFFLYLFSLLPFSVLYGISSIVAFALEKIIGYRKDVIRNNLMHAFPAKTEAEIKVIIHAFYRNLTDSMVETIKMLSMRPATLQKRAQMDVTQVAEVIASGQNVQFYAAHIFGWEYGNAIAALKLPVSFLGIYMQISNKATNRLFLKLRSRTGGELVSAQEMPRYMIQRDASKFVIGFIADQNPPNEKSAYWMNFFNRPVPFLTGPEKYGQRNNTAAFFVRTLKLKRGYYKFEIVPMSMNVSETRSGELTKQFRSILEIEIQKDPACYLWSHKRWKWQWDERFAKKWVE